MMLQCFNESGCPGATLIQTPTPPRSTCIDARLTGFCAAHGGPAQPRSRGSPGCGTPGWSRAHGGAGAGAAQRPDSVSRQLKPGRQLRTHRQGWDPPGQDVWLGAWDGAKHELGPASGRRTAGRVTRSPFLPASPILCISFSF